MIEAPLDKPGMGDLGTPDGDAPVPAPEAAEPAQDAPEDEAEGVAPTA